MTRKWLSGALALLMVFGCSAPVLADSDIVEVEELPAIEEVVEEAAEEVAEEPEVVEEAEEVVEAAEPVEAAEEPVEEPAEEPAEEIEVIEQNEIVDFSFDTGDEVRVAAGKTIVATLTNVPKIKAGTIAAESSDTGVATVTASQNGKITITGVAELDPTTEGDNRAEITVTFETLESNVRTREQEEPEHTGEGETATPVYVTVTKTIKVIVTPAAATTEWVGPDFYYDEAGKVLAYDGTTAKAEANDQGIEVVQGYSNTVYLLRVKGDQTEKINISDISVLSADASKFTITKSGNAITVTAKANSHDNKTVDPKTYNNTIKVRYTFNGKQVVEYLDIIVTPQVITKLEWISHPSTFKANTAPAFSVQAWEKDKYGDEVKSDNPQNWNIEWVFNGEVLAIGDTAKDADDNDLFKLLAGEYGEDFQSAVKILGIKPGTYTITAREQNNKISVSQTFTITLADVQTVTTEQVWDEAERGKVQSGRTYNIVEEIATLNLKTEAEAYADEAREIDFPDPLQLSNGWGYINPTYKWIVEGANEKAADNKTINAAIKVDGDILTIEETAALKKLIKSETGAKIKVYAQSASHKESTPLEFELTLRDVGAQDEVKIYDKGIDVTDTIVKLTVGEVRKLDAVVVDAHKFAEGTDQRLAWDFVYDDEVTKIIKDPMTNKVWAIIDDYGKITAVNATVQPITVTVVARDVFKEGTEEPITASCTIMITNDQGAVTVPTAKPATPTTAPVTPTTAPDPAATATADPYQPIDPTEAPAVPTEAPVVPTEAPVVPTEAPVVPTEAPVVPTEVPVTPTEAPVVTGTVTTKSDALNIRAAATTSSAIVTKAPKGTKLIINGEEGSFYKVTTPDGKNGYAAKAYVTINGSSTPAPVQPTTTTKTTTANLRLRTEPKTGSIITTMPKGSKVTVISSSNGWSKVTYNGQTGYASNDYLK